MTHDECVGALQRCGDEPRQAAFLALVMRTGGYFLRRHYAAFRRQVDGAVGTVFLRRAMARGHVERAPFVRRALVYHVASPGLYAAVGEPHHRSQRPAPIATVVERLMRLDVLVAHQDWTYWRRSVNSSRGWTLVACSSGTRAASCSWPGAAWMSSGGRGGSGAGPSASSPASRRRRSSTWPRRRPPPPTSTRSSRGTSGSSPGWARSGCCAAARGQTRFPVRKTGRSAQRSAYRQAVPHGRAGLRDTLLAHFEARQRFIRRQFRTFDDASRERLRLDLLRFGGAEYQALFTRWEAGGHDAVTMADVLHAATDGGGARFELTVTTHVVPFAYPVYGDGRREPRHRRAGLTKRAA